MIELPKPSSIENVFAMNEPHHMLSKLLWELQCLMNAESVWKDNESFPTPIFHAWNTAVTAWHISDWLWAAKPDLRLDIAAHFSFQYDETANGVRDGLSKFQDAVVAESSALKVCREIANGSKHMRKSKPDKAIRAVALWREVIEGAGVVVPGDFVLSLEVTSGSQTFDATHWFIEAEGYWERLFMDKGWLTGAMRLPDKIIRPGREIASKFAAPPQASGPLSSFRSGRSGSR